LKVAVGAGLFQKSAIVVNDGVQSHCGTACFQHESVFLLITSSLNFYWLHVHFVLAAAPGFSKMKPAVPGRATVPVETMRMMYDVLV
jgi:hypothetical protein